MTAEHVNKMWTLPTVFRSRDAEHGDVMQAVTQIIGEQSQHIEDNLQQLYEDLFIETSQPWVVPYIGELVGIRTADGGGGANESASRARRRRRLVVRPGLKGQVVLRGRSARAWA